jgi:hypothetical protein
MIKEDELLKVKYNLEIEVKNINTGKSKIIREHNIVTDIGLNLLCQVLAAETDARLKYIAIGDDDTAPASEDETLGNEVFRDIFTQISIEENKLTIRYFLSSTDANGITLIESALFGGVDASEAPNSGLMFARALHEAINKTSSDAVIYTWEITFS